MDAVVFFHMNQLGDLLFSLPALSGARHAWPQARLCSVVRPALAPLLEATGLVDTIIPRQRAGMRGFLQARRQIAQGRFSQAVLFSESPETVLLSYLSGIPVRRGFATASLRWLLTDTVPRAGVPSLRNNLTLASAAGIASLPPDYTGLLRIPGHAIETARQWVLRENETMERLVLLSPGASKRRQDKRWADEQWAALANLLAKHHFSPVLIGAPYEADALTAIALRSSRKPRVFASPGGILSLAGMMTLARAFVGTDSGAMHLAAACGLPVVALFGPTDPAQVGPRPLERHRIVARETLAAVSVEDVWAEVSGLLFAATPERSVP